MSEQGRYSDSTLYRRLLRQARPYWLHVTGVFLISLLSTPIALLTPLPLKIAVDSALGDHPLPGPLAAVLPNSLTQPGTGIVFVAAGLVVAVALLRQIQELSSTLLRTYAGERLVLEFRALLFRHVQRLSLGFHDARGTASSIYNIQYDAPAVQRIAIDGVVPFITSIATLVSMIYVTALIDGQLALVAIAISPILFVITGAYRGRLKQQSKDVKKLESSAMSIIQEVLTALRVVKAFGQEDREQSRFLESSSDGMRARIRLAVIEGSYGILVGTLTAIGTAAVLYIGVSRVQAGAVTLGDLLLVMGYLSQLYDPLKTMSKRVASLQGSLVSAARAYELLDQEPDVPERPDARPLARAVGDIEFRNVSFGYNDELTIRDVSFEVPTGSRVGIMGTTGAGKTTLVSLLTRFYDPCSGQIELDGVDLREYRIADLRSQFAIVLQEPVLFSTSVAENIAYAKPDATEHEVVTAAKAASAHDFIRELSDGYNTPVGERGMRLSGGERQRIALARAFLKDAPILILDEPTSSVDVHTEELIMEAMERLSEGRTAFMIAHRLSTLEHCDIRIMVENGSVVHPNGHHESSQPVPQFGAFPFVNH